MRITVLRTNGTKEEIEVERRRDFAKLIGAEVLCTVGLRDGRTLYIDDLGHQKGLAFNKQATELYWAICRPGTTHQIVGDVIIANDADFR